MDNECVYFGLECRVVDGNSMPTCTIGLRVGDLDGCL